jgi:hypothetical protein
VKQTLETVLSKTKEQLFSKPKMILPELSGVSGVAYLYDCVPFIGDNIYSNLCMASGSLMGGYCASKTLRNEAIYLYHPIITRSFLYSAIATTFQIPTLEDIPIDIPLQVGENVVRYVAGFLLLAGLLSNHNEGDDDNGKGRKKPKPSTGKSKPLPTKVEPEIDWGEKLKLESTKNPDENPSKID